MFAWYKNVNILYVEENPDEKLLSYLTSKYGNVIIEKDGVNGLTKYKEFFSSNKKINLIVSALNLKFLNGIEMFEEIRRIHQEANCIFISQNSEKEILLKAIELNVDGFFLKPVKDYDTVIEKIDNILIKYYYEEQLLAQKIKMGQYSNALNEISIIFKMNREGLIFDKNDNYKEIFDDSKENFKDIIHSEVSLTQQNEVWKTLEEGKIWSGITKFVNKEGENIYLKMSIFNNYNEFITIGFNNTEEQTKKRIFHKNVINKLKDNNFIIQNLKKENENLSSEIIQLKVSLNSYVDSDKQTDKINNLLKQINHYEQQMENIESFKDKALKEKHDKIEELLSTKRMLEAKVDSLKKRNDFIEHDLKKKEEKINEADAKRIEDAKKINDLYDVIDYMEKNGVKPE